MHDFIKALIQKNGPIDIGQFMSLALGHPQLGYYMKQDPFGANGDFTTAPEISQMFGEMIAAWILEVWQQMGTPSPFTLLECGPGRGTLMVDIMRSLKNVPGFHDAAQVHLMEISPVLKQMQGAALASYNPKWHVNLETVPDQPMIVIANEFLDALPVRQLIKSEKGWDERLVTLAGEEFGYTTRPLPIDIGVVAKVGDIFEISPVRSGFVADLVKKMSKNSEGAALLIDYGHAHSGFGDTLQAIKDHKYVSPLEFVGDADLTTHVDFEAVRKAAEGAGAQVTDPVEQGAWLRTIGIQHRADTLKAKANEAQKFDIEKALQRLTDSSQMGSLFKVIGITNGANINLPGF